MNDIEKENQPVSPVRNQARKSLEFSSSVSLGGSKLLDGNVGIGLSENNVNKRQRSQGEEEEDLWKSRENDDHERRRRQLHHRHHKEAIGRAEKGFQKNP